MSFLDSATEALDRAEASLNSLLMDALKAKAYRDVAAIAALAEAVAAIPGRVRDGRKLASSDLNVAAAAPSMAPEPAKASEPSWMRPKSS
jgi:hypothetical protein